MGWLSLDIFVGWNKSRSGVSTMAIVSFLVFEQSPPKAPVRRYGFRQGHPEAIRLLRFARDDGSQFKGGLSGHHTTDFTFILATICLLAFMNMPTSTEVQR